jgi:hypothetical protein
MLREALLSGFKDECTLVEPRFVDGTSKLTGLFLRRKPV